MKKSLLLVVLLFVISSSYAQKEISPVRDQVIVRFKSAVSVNSISREKLLTGCPEADQLAHHFGVIDLRKLNTGIKSGYSAIVLKFPKDTELNSLLDELNKMDEVEYAEADGIGFSSGVRGVSPDDQYYYRQWGLKNDGSFSGMPAVAGADIEMEEGWAIEQGDSSIVVGIIDSGCKLNHPELQNRIWKNYEEIAGNGIDDDNNNYTDDFQGWDFANSDNNPTDDFGHGTNVTGIIGAQGNNGIGYAGVDWNCKLMILKGINSSNWGYYSWWIDAINYAVDNGAKVLNLSLGGTDISTALQDAINNALANNVTVVACMMNTNSNTIFYPAAYQGVIAVGATNPDDKRSHPFFWSNSSGSNYGPHISVVAPGNYIYGLDYQSNNQYGYFWGGTSQATPYVCGLASLILAQDPNKTPAEIKTLIQSTAEDQVGNPIEDTPGWDQYYGYGRINAFNALTLLSGIGNDEKTQEDITIFPNPNDGNFKVLAKSIPGDNAIIRIETCSGQVVYSKIIEGSLNAVSIPPVKGVYIITLIRGNKSSSAKLIVY